MSTVGSDLPYNFYHTTQNWLGKTLVSREVMVNLIGSTTIRNVLKIRAELNDNEYQTGIEIAGKKTV
ncbi:MAG: ISAzo13-like element transposase-related protein [Methanosarcinaceae archaeon]